MKSLRDRVAVITGAGSGIGRATAQLLAQKGARVHVVDIDQARAETVAAEIRDGGGDAEHHCVDVTDAAQVEALASAVFSKEGRVDLLHNNAGVGHAGAVEETDLATWKRVIDVNLWGTIHGVHAFVPRMLGAGGESHIVNTASGLGLVAAPGMAPYCTTKFAVVGMSEVLAAELRPKGIFVSVICPGIIRTDIVRAASIGPQYEGAHSAALEFYDARGVDPAAVARAALRAVRHKRVVQLSPVSQVYPLWLLKRALHPLYMWAIGVVGVWMKARRAKTQ